MSDTTVSFKIKITDEGGFKNVEFDAKKLRDAIEEVKNQADKVNSKLLNSNQLAQAFEQVTSAVQGLQSVMHDLTDAYAVQAQAETRLVTVMRNTMDATDAEIQSIKDLAAAQQELGVVGDEVQLSGAQELATYLGKKESLEKLIPVMNDMIAQQYGYNATAESAVSIATMMGKVMEGQTKALSRYGYSFTEAQEEILKFGTEEERAATLAEVIEQSVGGVNAALAATDYGKIVQENNKFCDLKESIGSVIAPTMTVVDGIARISIAIAGLGKGIATINSLKASFETLGVKVNLTAVSKRLLGKAGLLAAEGTTALRVSVIALKTAISAGIIAAIYGLIQLFIALKDRTDAATRAKEDFAKASEDAKTKFEEEGSKLQDLIGLIQDETAARTDQVAAIEILKEKYPDLVAKYIDEEGHITNLIGLQKELNRLRAGEKFQADRDKLEEYKTKAEDYRKLTDASTGSYDPLWWQSADTSVPGKELIKDRPWWQSPEDYVREQAEYYSTMVKEQQTVVDNNKKTEWKTSLKDSSTEELDALLQQYQTRTSWNGSPLFPEKIADINAELELRKQKTVTQNKAYWENIKKQKQAEYDALDKSELGSEKALALKGEIDSAKENIALFDTGSGKTKPDKKEDNAYKAAIEASEKTQRKAASDAEKSYLQGTITREQYEKKLSDITITGLEERLDIAQRYGQDETKIQQSLNNARIQRNEADYNALVKQLNEFTAEEKDCLKEQLESKQITQEQYDLKVLENDLWNADQRLKVAQTYNQDTAEIVREQNELRVQLGEQGYSMEQKQLDDSLAKKKATLTQQLLDQVITQEQYDRLILVEMEKYYKARLSLAEAYGKAETGDTQAWLDAQLDLQKYDKSAGGQQGKVNNAGKAWKGMEGVADSFRDIKSAITDTDNAWDALTRTVDGFIGAFDNVSSVIEIIKNITEATTGMRIAKEAATASAVAGNAAEAASEGGLATAEITANAAKVAANTVLSTSNTAAAATAAAAAVAGIPIVGPAVALAWAATIEAALSAIPKFADGGIVYGPTIGLMGEYSGAKSNPEVIAPLSKLQGLLGGWQGRSEVKFRIEGRELVGILNKQNNIYQRNG